MSLYGRLNRGTVWHRIQRHPYKRNCYSTACDRVMPAGETRVTQYDGCNCKVCLEVMAGPLSAFRQLLESRLRSIGG